MTAGPHIVWPTIGFPLVLEAGTRRCALLIEHSETDADTLLRWAGGLRLRDRVAIESWPANVIEVAPDSADAHPPALDAPILNGRGRARVTIELGERLEPVAPRGVRVFDLCDGDRVLRANAIATVAADRTLRVAFASDLHIAAMWDEVSATIERYAPELANVAHHPSRLLRDLVAQANELAARGDLDLVVLGGDLVDHVYARPRAEVERGARSTNVEILLALLSDLQVPTFAIPGNHDYRLYPWRLRSYSLGSINLSKAQQRRFLRAAGLWGWSPLLPSDIDAIRTEAAHHVALQQHRHFISPLTDFHVQMRGMTLLFANSGRDIAPRWRELERRQWPLFARSLPGSWVDPDSEGLHQEQVQRIEHTLAGAGPAALFVHAPLLHAREGAAASIDLDPGDPDDAHHFDRRLFASGLRNGVLFRNCGRLVRALLDHRGPTTLLSGHVHHDTAITVARRTRTAKLGRLQAPADSREEIPLITTPSLGHRRHAGAERPGFLLITFRDGAVQHVERRSVSEWR